MIWIRKILELLLLLMVASLWGHVGRSKFHDHEFFYYQIQGEGVGKLGAMILSYGIPILAILAGSLLVFSIIIPKVKVLAFSLSAGLLATFTFYMLYILKFAFPPPCYCIALSPHLTWKQQLLISTFLLILCFIQLSSLLMKKRKSKEHILS